MSQGFAQVLVTGGGGFIGGALVRRLLDQGVAVRSLSRQPYPELEALGVTQLQASIEDAPAVTRACEGCDVVFHVAGMNAAWGRRAAFYRTNVTGTEVVVQACRAAGVPRLVFTSSPMAVFDGTHQAGIDERHPYPPQWPSLYAETKAKAEQLVMAANGKGLTTVSLRPRLVWGPGDNSLIPRIVHKARAGQLQLIGRKSPAVDWTCIDNAVDAHLLAAEQALPDSPAAGQTYFISNGAPLPIDALINHILGAYGLGPVTRRVPAGVAYTLGAAMEGAWTLLRREDEPPLTRFVVLNLTRTNWFDIGAARRDLGYEPRVSLEEGLEQLRAAGAPA